MCSGCSGRATGRERSSSPTSPGKHPRREVDLGLRDRVVLITGAGGGVGPTLARAFTAEGAAVALQHRGGHSGDRAAETTEGIVADGGRAITVEADLGSESAVDAMV